VVIGPFCCVENTIRLCISKLGRHAQPKNAATRKTNKKSAAMSAMQHVIGIGLHVFIERGFDVPTKNWLPKNVFGLHFSDQILLPVFLASF